MNRPYVVCHMCTSIDGKVLVDRWGKLPGGKGGGSLFETTAASFGIGAWLVGTTTMREFSAPTFRLPDAKHRPAAGDHLADPDAETFAIGVDAKGSLRFKKPEVEGDHTVVLTTERAGSDYRAHLQRAGVSYLICGRTQVDLPLALRKLRASLGLRKLMLQGGGTFNGSMLRAGLVDEVSQVIVPVADGGGADVTGVFDAPDGPGKRAAAKLRPVAHKVLPGGVHWLRYRVVSRM